MDIKILELFGGIGACSKALERIGINYTIVDYVEIDKYAVKSFNAIHNTNFEPQDITKWNKDIDVDLIMHGSPCQDFSINGKGKGGDKGSGTRSSLMYETIRIVSDLNPKYVIWENVKNLLSKKHKHNFDEYIYTMDSLGYNSYYQVLNSKDYGIPQNRERVFTISIRKDINKKFNFPERQELKIKLKDILEENVDEKYYLTEKGINGRLKTKFHKYKLFENVINNKEVHPTIIAGYNRAPSLYIKNNTKKGYLEANDGDGIDLENMNSNTRRGRVQKEIVQTINTKDNKGVCLMENKLLRVRKLTPLEIWILMGFDKEDYLKASKVNSNTQLYKQAGNSIVVNVLEAILLNLLKGGDNYKENSFDCKSQ